MFGTFVFAQSEYDTEFLNIIHERIIAATEPLTDFCHV